jgi:hypothetical protein
MKSILQPDFVAHAEKVHKEWARFSDGSAGQGSDVADCSETLAVSEEDLERQDQSYRALKTAVDAIESEMKNRVKEFAPWMNEEEVNELAGLLLQLPAQLFCRENLWGVILA